MAKKRIITVELIDIAEDMLKVPKEELSVAEGPGVELLVVEGPSAEQLGVEDRG